MPELPAERRARYVREFDLNPYEVGVLTQESSRTDLFDVVLGRLIVRFPNVDEKILAKKTSNWVMTEVVRKSNETAQPATFFLDASVSILTSNTASVISYNAAKDIFHEPWVSLQEIDNKIEKRTQVSDEAAIAEACDRVLAAESAKVAEYRAGRDKLYGFFVGAVMKAMGGKGNPKVVNEVLRRKLAG
jgi:aspartyl-tRNA(Asn)/glutamyl-tRNA(Gln) amidotransferase subunit B